MRVMIGTDPHKATHTAVAIDDNEMMLDEVRVRACISQVTRLRSRAVPFPDRVWAVESARGLGYLLAQQLVEGRRDGDRCASGGVDAYPIVGVGSGAEERSE